MSVNDIDATVKTLRDRGVTIVGERFDLPAVSRRPAVFSDPYGTLIELAQVL